MKPLVLPSISRRAFSLGAASLLVSRKLALASPRSPIGGKAKLRLPWPLASIDPHRLDDFAAAILGPALFDSLYAIDSSGEPVPALAESMPTSDGAGGLRVTVRQGLTTAHGSAIDARDVSLSIARSRSHGGAGWLAALPSPKREGEKSLTFATTDAAALARALASPITAIVPLSFDPSRPDGTGPFKADHKDAMLVLTRNSRAAMGPSLLDGIDVAAGDDLAASLRAFESGEDDIGWLGSGLHEPRTGSKTFDAGAIGWAVLVIGREASSWDSPGIAQRVCDGVAPSRLAYLSMGPPWASSGAVAWSGPPIDLLAPSDSPWLVELAKAVAAAISQTSHEVTPRFVSAADFAQRRKGRNFPLAVDAVRMLGPGALGAMTALASADPSASAVDLVRHPPKLAELPARSLTRTLRLGVLGEVRVQGGRVADLSLPTGRSGIDWGLASRAHKHA